MLQVFLGAPSGHVLFEREREEVIKWKLVYKFDSCSTNLLAFLIAWLGHQRFMRCFHTLYFSYFIFIILLSALSAPHDIQ